MALNIPLPEAPPGGLYGGMRAANELTRSNLQNALLGIENQYAPFRNYAQTASQLAYSQFVGPQAIANILTNPATRGLLSKEQTNQLANAFIQQTQGAGVMGNIPRPQDQSSGGLWGMLMDAISNLGKPNKPQVATQQELAKTPPPTFRESSYSGDHSQDYGEKNKMSEKELDEFVDNLFKKPVTPVSNIGYGTPATQQAQKQLIPGTVGPENPAAAQQRMEKAAETASTGQAQTEVKQWHTAFENEAKNSQALRDLKAGILQFDTNFKAAKIKGPGAGKLFDPYGAIAGLLNQFGVDVTPEQLVGASKSDILSLLARARNSGHITDDTYKLLSGAKLDPAMTDKAERIAADSLLTNVSRQQEKLPFLNYITRVNPDILNREAEDLWRLYNEQYPAYNKTEQRPNPHYQDKWDVFATPQALNQLRQTGRFKAPKIEEPKKEEIKQIKEKSNKYKNTPYTYEDWEHTAKKYGITIEDAMRRAGY